MWILKRKPTTTSSISHVHRVSRGAKTGSVWVMESNSQSDLLGEHTERRAISSVFAAVCWEALLHSSILPSCLAADAVRYAHVEPLLSSLFQSTFFDDAVHHTRNLCL